VARIVEQVSGQLRVDSGSGGSRFSLLLPFSLPNEEGLSTLTSITPSETSLRSQGGSQRSGPSEIDSWVTAFSDNHMGAGSPQSFRIEGGQPQPQSREGVIELPDTRTPLRAVRVDEFDIDRRPMLSPSLNRHQELQQSPPTIPPNVNSPPPTINTTPVIHVEAPKSISNASTVSAANTESLRILLVDVCTLGFCANML